jgi:hypothetical protein
LQPRQPAVSLDDLALMLEIDLTVLGDKHGFQRRLKRALENAFQQGQTKQRVGKISI